MRIYTVIFSAAILITSCKQEDNSAQMTFDNNSETILAYLEDWQNESIDYEKYFADDVVLRPTRYNSKDSVGLDVIISSDKWNWDEFDFKKPENINLLPGVNPDTREEDGSVRYYGNWTIILPATDSTESKSFELKVYQSFDFNPDGKIIFMQSYADWGGLLDAIEDFLEGEDEESEGDIEVQENDEMEE